jgi:hypothetical protein
MEKFPQSPVNLPVNSVHPAQTTFFYVYFSEMFGSVVVIAFQSVFYSEMHQNNVFFLFFLNYF